jgi:acyl carrier protein
VEIRKVLREYLQQQCRDAAGVSPLTDSTPLLTYGILDSIAVMQLLMFIEATFEIELDPRDLDRRRLDTIEQLEQLVLRKIEQRSGAATLGGREP